MKKDSIEKHHGINYDEFSDMKDYREYIKKLIKENKPH